MKEQSKGLLQLNGNMMDVSKTAYTSLPYNKLGTIQLEMVCKIIIEQGLAAHDPPWARPSPLSHWIQLLKLEGFACACTPYDLSSSQWHSVGLQANAYTCTCPPSAADH